MIRQTWSIFSETLDAIEALSEDERASIDSLDFWSKGLLALNSVYQFLSHGALELDLGIDVENRKIYINGEIGPEFGLIFTQKIDIINKFSVDREFSKEPIFVYINSCGGDVYTTFAAVDAIRACKCPIVTIGTGQIMSAASLLLAAGTGGRYLTPNSSIMLHEMLTELSGNTSQLRISTNHMNKLQEDFYSIYAEFTKKSASFWKRKMSGELYLSAADAVKYGLADKIIHSMDEINGGNHDDNSGTVAESNPDRE